MEAAGGSRVVVMSVASKRKSAVCLMAGKGVLGRVPDTKVWSQAAVGNRCRALRCCVSSAARLVAMFPSLGSCDWVLEGRRLSLVNVGCRRRAAQVQNGLRSYELTPERFLGTGQLKLPSRFEVEPLTCHQSYLGLLKHSARTHCEAFATTFECLR